MNVCNLFEENENITLESYLNKFGIKDIEEYLNPTGKYLDNGISYRNMLEAVQDFKWHYNLKDPAYILCDNDADGILSTCIMYQYMKLLNPKWNIKILLHDNKERGLNDDKLYKRLLDEPRPLLIIPDAGSNEVVRTKVITETNCTVIVLDHHNIETPIDTGVLISNQVGEVDKFGSGCVVTHKFLQCLDAEFNVKYSSRFIDMVALSIISDSMNICSYQNRTYLYFGLFKDNAIKNDFLKALFDKFIYHDTFTLRDISFNIVPKINSVCRSGDNELKQKLIMAFIGRADAEEVAELCEKCHENQIKYVTKFVSDSKNNIDDEHNIIIYNSDELKLSYTGLIAGKLSDAYNRPCIVGRCNNEELVGSLRSPIPLAEEINETGLAKMKGHSMACGCFLPIENIDKLYEYMDSIDINYQPDIPVMQSYYADKIPDNLFDELIGYNIWDIKFLPEPIIYVKDIKIKGKDISVLGKNKKTIKFIYKNIEFISFKATKELKEELCIGKNKMLKINLIGKLNKNVYYNKKTNQVLIDKIEVMSYNSDINEIW